MYDYQLHNTYTAQVADGIENLAQTELQELGATDCVCGFRYVHFKASARTLYRIVYRARLISRVLAPLARFACPADQDLYNAGMAIRWTDFLNADQTFAIFANVSKSAIGHSQYAGLKLKDAVADWFRDHTGIRPSVDPRDPDLWLHLHIHEDVGTISLDVSGGSMHRRGYRVQSVEAPMNETVAAAIIRMSGWDGKSPLIDPLCGSGTILCEAFMHATNLPAGLLRRKFGFNRLPDFNPRLWDLELAAETTVELEADLRGSDIDPVAVEATRTNMSRLPGGDEVIVGRRDFFERSDMTGTTIICNPPYGIRLGKSEDMAPWFKMFGDHLKRQCSGSTAYVYFGDRAWLKCIGLKPEWKKPLKNGGLDGRLAKFVLY
ncbi:putative N6-adenine-specific DNA methylase [Desulfomicrobium macestii]|uniref:N6-adenine-specific DNA methylase n=1 Tax=Desulfomicrobium macestii TaxID=90731 RepID=A0ABR9GZ22_9BACT|nr:THUMP domain-containing protein [Desulfomicrobium macestii]MBE1423700.1 putative N6-adenine-specific DNA methylase [Desulfomicrobium macestii]